MMIVRILWYLNDHKNMRIMTQSHDININECCDEVMKDKGGVF